MEQPEKVVVTVIGISAFIVILARAVGAIGDSASANGYNIWDGIYIHKTLIGYLLRFLELSHGRANPFA